MIPYRCERFDMPLLIKVSLSFAIWCKGYEHVEADMPDLSEP